VNPQGLGFTRIRAPQGGAKGVGHDFGKAHPQGRYPTTTTIKKSMRFIPMLGGSQKPGENRLGFHAGSLVIT
jgi:hypothetical protein